MNRPFRWISSLAALACLGNLAACRPADLHLAGQWQCGDFALTLARDGGYWLRSQQDGQMQEVRGAYRIDQEAGALRIRYDNPQHAKQQYVYVPGHYPAEGFYLNTRPDLQGEPKLCVRRGGWV